MKEGGGCDAARWFVLSRGNGQIPASFRGTVRGPNVFKNEMVDLVHMRRRTCCGGADDPIVTALLLHHMCSMGSSPLLLPLEALSRIGSMEALSRVGSKIYRYQYASHFNPYMISSPTLESWLCACCSVPIFLLFLAHQSEAQPKLASMWATVGYCRLLEESSSRKLKLFRDNCFRCVVPCTYL